MSFLTIMHLGGGSEVEAAAPVTTVGPYATAQEAENAGETVLNAVHYIDYLNEECFYTIVEIPDQFRGTQPAIEVLLGNEDEGDDTGEVVEVINAIQHLNWGSSPEKGSW